MDNTLLVGAFVVMEHNARVERVNREAWKGYYSPGRTPAARRGKSAVRAFLSRPARAIHLFRLVRTAQRMA